jgi:hypothetical protein
MRYLCAAFAVLMLGAAPAAAGGACCGHRARGPVVPVAIYRFEAPVPARQVYVVNQGPVLSGPGIYAYTNTYVPGLAPTHYPYMDRHYAVPRPAVWYCHCGVPAHGYCGASAQGYCGVPGQGY